jgi:uncharacterized RDD family membrane protein YckC
MVPPDRPEPYNELAPTAPMPVVNAAPVAAPTPAGETPMSAKPSRPPKAPYAPIFGHLAGYAFSRSVALLVDFILIPLVVCCFAFNAADRGTIALAPRTASGFGTILGLSFGVALLCAIVFETLFETTAGKAFFALGVRRSDGRHAGLQRIALRYALLPIDLLVVGEVLALVTRRHQRLGDLLAGTVVARHRAGAFVTALAIVLVGGLIYAQATVGGGLSSILAVAAESTYHIPEYVSSVLDRSTHPANVPDPKRSSTT